MSTAGQAIRRAPALKSVGGLPEIRARRFDHDYGQAQIANLLTVDQQQRLNEIATIREMAAGDVICAEGEEAAHFHMTAAGIVRLSREAGAGRRQVLAFMMPGDVFGFPEQGRYAYSAMAVCAVRLHQVPWQRLSELMRQEPLLQTSLLIRMAFDLRQAYSHMLVLGQQNVSQRLVSFLLGLTEHAEFYDPVQRQLLLPVSRFDLGDYLGTSPESVARVMAQLEKDGLICRLSSRLLLVPKVEALVELLQGRRRND